MSDAERAEAVDRWKKGITRVYNGDRTSEDFRYFNTCVKGDIKELGADANAGEEEDKDGDDSGYKYRASPSSRPKPVENFKIVSLGLPSLKTGILVS